MAGEFNRIYDIFQTGLTGFLPQRAQRKLTTKALRHEEKVIIYYLKKEIRHGSTTHTKGGEHLPSAGQAERAIFLDGDLTSD